MLRWKQSLPYLLFATILVLYSGAYYGQLVPTDAVSYVSIAEKYAGGHFSTAINAYWSPLFSWLIALQLKLGISTNAAVYCIKLVAGLLIIFFSGKIITRYQWPDWAKLLCSSLIAIATAAYTLRYATPDNLMAAGLVMYLYIIISGWWLKHPLLTGAVGAFLYFTKAFGFYFFPAYLALLLGWKLLSNRQHFLSFFRKGTAVVLVFGLISFPWLLAVHQRYHKWTISTAGSYNHNLFRYGYGSVQPALKSGLLPLPDAAAYNAWEEITLVHTYTDWSPFTSQQNLRLQLQVLYDNVWGVYQYLRGLHLLLPMAGLAAFLLAGWYGVQVLRRKPIPFAFRTSAYVVAFISLYAFGYCLAGLDYRYLYIVFIGMFFLFFDVLVLLQNGFRPMALLRYGLAAWLVGQSSYRLLADIHLHQKEQATQMADVQILKTIIPAGSIIATHATNTLNAMDYWGGWHNHGGLEAYQTTTAAVQALQRYRVQWVLLPAAVQQQYKWLQPISDTAVTLPRWQVYRLRPPLQ